MYVIAGLGNPGEKYDKTRHNVGFEVIDLLSERFGIPVKTRKCKGRIGKGVIGGMDVVLVKPQTFMNLSGECIREVLDFYKVPVENLVVLCDDIHLPAGRLRIRKGGSDGGHHGLENIILHLHTNEFKRIRIGVGIQPEFMDRIRFVLSRFPEEERGIMDDAYKRASDAAIVLFAEGIDRAMNLYNGKGSYEST